MSALGDFITAGNAKAIGKFNNALYQNQASYVRAKAEQNRAVFKKVTEPLIKKQQEAQYSSFFVNALNSGAEFREGESTYLVGLETKMNMAFDLEMANFNSDMDYIDQQNNASLLAAKGTGELYKGKMAARAAYVKGFTSLLGSANKAGYIDMGRAGAFV
tara:strand:- start:692 stop:1171 length:480 start_codon:yes stop_codon:yes gene_type:complete